MEIRIGCAGWSIARELAGRFSGEGSHLVRYSGKLPAVEINTSFYRPHRPATYARWAATVPPEFRFAAKVPRDITHRCRLENADQLIERFLDEVGSLGTKLGPLLLQLPPSLALVPTKTQQFLASLCRRFAGPVVCEPRHRSWFTTEADRLLADHGVARVAADPAVVPQAAEPGGWNGMVYYRLHGSPKMYYSPYSPEYLDALAPRLRHLAAAAPVWCIFDNTAQGHALANALEVWQRVTSA
jgi:uncharacterized protein YecE (DUF72 family)